MMLKVNILSGFGSKSGRLPEYITWLGQVNVTESSGSSLTKSGGASPAWNAGAYSDQQIISGDGGISCVPASTAGNRILGLNNATNAAADSDWTNIDYGLLLLQPGDGGTVQFVESGSIVSGATSFDAGSFYEVCIEGGEIKYKKDGVTLRTVASPTLNYPLVADCSIELTTSTLDECKITV